MFSGVRLPTPSGATTSSLFSSGTQGGYRLNDHFTGTVDVTASVFGSQLSSQTAEVGGRYAPLPLDEPVRPFLDMRAAYLHVSDMFDIPAESAAIPGYAMTRYANGFGGIVGAGFAYSLTNSLGLSTELSAVRGHMNAYHTQSPTGIPYGTGYSMTQV